MNETPSAPDRRGAGLRLFRPGTPRAYRRHRLAFVVFALAVTASLLWPVYPRFASPFPLVFGLPFSLAWLLGALVLMFSGLLALYLSDDHHRPADAPSRDGDGR